MSWMVAPKLSWKGTAWAWMWVMALCVTQVSVWAGPVTVKLRPRETRCLWNDMALGDNGRVEVFVESGGKLNARLEIKGPFKSEEGSVPTISDQQAPVVHDAVFSSAETTTKSFASPTEIKFVAAGAGAYRVCVENTGSRFENKVVSIEFETSGIVNEDQDIPMSPRNDPQSSESIAELTRRLVDIRTELSNLKKKQVRERRRLAHHRALNDASHIAIVEGSLLETVVYIFASTFQIIFVRKWFEGKSVTTIFGNDNV